KPLDLALLNVRLSVAERQIQEIAERSPGRGALQESARAMTEILEKTTDAFFAVDREWKFIYLNPEAETLLGRRRDEVIGKELWKEFPQLNGSPFGGNFRRGRPNKTPGDFKA